MIKSSTNPLNKSMEDNKMVISTTEENSPPKQSNIVLPLQGTPEAYSTVLQLNNLIKPIKA